MLSFRKLGQGWTVDECTWSTANGMKETKSWPNDSKETSGGGPYVAFGMQRVSSNYCWNCDDDASYNFMFCKVNPPPPPPPPPSPPPSPPPPGGFPIEKPTVEIKNKVKFVSDAEVDFDIRVKDSDGCMNGENDCFAFASYDTNKRRGLYCKVRVCGEEVEEAARDSLPSSKYLSKDSCKKWDNFYDDSKRGVHKKFLTTIKDDEGNLAQGTYTISYTCGWKKKTGQYLEGSVVSSTDFHTFTMVEGCSERLADDLTPYSIPDKTLARFFLMSTPGFLSAECDKLDVAKEDAFRKYDIDPLDGKLSAHELETAFLEHSVDLTYLKDTAKDNFEGIFLSEIMNSRALPLSCSQVTGASDVYFKHLTYPTLDTNKNECDAQTRKIDLTWDYAKEPTLSDFMCIFADGFFFQKGPESK